MFEGDWEFIGTASCDDTREEKMSYNVNDIIICKVKDNKIIESTRTDFDSKVSFKVIGKKEYAFSSTEYLIYVPEYELARISPDYVVDRKVIRDCKIDPRFEGDHMEYVKSIHVCGIEYKAEGEKCTRCNEWFDHAVNNQPDGTFRCQACLLNPYR